MVESRDGHGPMLSSVLFLMHDRPDYPSGPIVNYLRLLPKLSSEGIEVHVIVVYGTDYPNARALRQSGITIHPVRRHYTESMVKSIFRVVEDVQPDVFVPDVSVPGCFAGKWVKAAGIPVVNTHRSDDELNWGKALYFSDPRYGFELSGIVCVSKYLRDGLLEKVPGTSVKTEVIPSGVPVPTLMASQDGEGLRIVYAGRLTEKQKRAPAMISAFLRAAERFPLCSFTIVGDGPERERCEAMVCESAYEKRFTFTGRLDGDAYKAELARHHVIVLLSDYEGTPGSVMDGMSCGLVPICMKFNGADELIDDGENGFFVADREEGFLDAVGNLYINPALRHSLAIKAREKVQANYSLQVAEEKWIAFLRLLKAAAGEKRKFVAPSRILLPSKNAMLVEDRRLSDVSMLRRLHVKFKALVGR